MTYAEQLLREFLYGQPFTDSQGRPVVEMLTYSCGPVRVDGIEDGDMVAIRVEGEPRDGLTVCDPKDLKYG